MKSFFRMTPPTYANKKPVTGVLVCISFAVFCINLPACVSKSHSEKIKVPPRVLYEHQQSTPSPDTESVRIFPPDRDITGENIRSSYEEQQIREKQHIFEGNQGVATGIVSVKDALKVFNKINFKPPSFITFNEIKITNHISGGNCSAMSLTLIHDYLNDPVLNTAQASKAGTEDRLAQISKLYFGGELSQKFRNMQAAFNTIEILPGLRHEEDYDGPKIMALAKYYNLTVTFSSDPLEMPKIRGPPDQSWAETLKKLPHGVYLLRGVKPNDNEKLEKYGHSVVYIKSAPAGDFYYDPNTGTYSINTENPADDIFFLVWKHMESFYLERFRFHKIEAKKTGTQ